MTFEQLYRNYLLQDSVEGKDARKLLEQADWYYSVAEFDPRTAEALPQPLSSVLGKIAKPNNSSTLKDRLWRIAEHVRSCLEALFREINESPRREQALLPLRAVRELDTASFMALSRRPGRNIREKLAGKPYLQAVRHFQSVDLPENRLLKAFSERLAELLELRVKCLGEEPDELIVKIRSWLRTDNAYDIGRWENLPPNNALLSHRLYRAVYDAWRWLQSLDDDITMDLERLESRQSTKQTWIEYGRMFEKSQHLFAEMPVLFDYEKFEIRPWTNRLFVCQTKRPFTRPTFPTRINVPVCVDLAELRPHYAALLKDSSARGFSSRKIYSCPLLWQRWQNSDLSTLVDVNLFKADAVFLHSEAITISAPELFFSRKHSFEYLDCAARSFVAKLRQTFSNDALLWLQPDFLNDFELEITRRNINALFPEAEPLPRSVAAVFEKVDYKSVREGFAVVVIDNIGDVLCATKLEARFDNELEKRLPEMYGFYWERIPPVILSKETSETQNDTEGAPQVSYDIVTLDSQGKWRNAEKPETADFIDKNALRQDERIGNFASLINIYESPVLGGIRLFDLQKKAGDVPLWRDQIPELSIKARVNGRYQRFYLVSRGTSIKPIRGQAVQIPVAEEFALPAGKGFYQFPLFMGENEDTLGYSAKLESPAFPLSNSVTCRLKMTFTYGADDPYCLIFEPIDSPIPPIRARWQKTVEEIITDAPSPEYPKPMTWEELRRFPKPNSNETSDLLEWVERECKFLLNALIDRTTGVISNHWQTDRNNYHFTFAYCDKVDNNVFIHEKSFVNGVVYSDYQKGDCISFVLMESECNKTEYTGWKVAEMDYNEKQGKILDADSTFELITRIRKSLYFPVIQVWNDGRSICDNQCPMGFSERIVSNIRIMKGLLINNRIPDEIKGEIHFLLSCMHKDAPDECIQWIKEQVESGKIRDHQAIGFALGDVTETWQRNIFDQLVGSLNDDTLYVFAYAIWQDRHFVELFSLSQYHSILDHLMNMLANIKPCTSSKKGILRNWARATAEPLELLLGLLRTRSSSNVDIKMLLQPHQKITKSLAEQVERVADIVAKSHATLFSRVQLGNLPPKPDGDRTPDLLYALRLYLTGDDGANAIQITSVSDGDSE